jgi:anti-sigma regulatory factor (Ser/Thr protein kinase)
MANSLGKTYRFEAGFGREEVLQLREDVAKQMHQAGVSGERSYALINVLDEFCCNMMEHSAAHWVEIAVEASKDDIHARLRDDGVAFDPVSAIREVDPSSPAKATERRLGLYMIGMLAKDLSYKREAGVNHLEFSLRS